MHLDAAVRLVPPRLMSKLLQVKIRAQFAIDARKYIQVECRGNARAIVVGPLDNRLRLFEVYADQQSPASTGEALNVPERRPVQISFPLSHFQQVAMPESSTAYRCLSVRI